MDAIENASEGDKIIICKGKYKEYITIDLPISIYGINRPIIHGMYNQSILTISSNYVNIRNLLFCYSGGKNNDAGVNIQNGQNISIINCTFHHLRNAIIVNNCSNIKLINNSFSNNGNGIFIKHSEFIVIEHNGFSHNAIGIVTNNSSYLTTINSSFLGNGMCGLFSTSKNIDISFCNLSDNSVNKGGLFLESISHANIHHCKFHHNGDSISISLSKNITIRNCEFTHNTHFAISLRSPSYNIQISHCIIKGNKRTGIYIEANNQCSIIENNIENNYLYDIYGDTFECFAEENWWGTINGPINNKNNLFTFIFFVDSYPWALKKFQDIGIQNHTIPHCKETYFEEDWEIIFDSLDSDQDYIPDWWEIKWGYAPYEWENHKTLDPDKDGLSNIQECYTDPYGSNPYVKDIFLEIDWMNTSGIKSNKPSEDLINNIIDEFTLNNITLHVDIGDLGEGKQIPEICTKTSRYLALHNLYWTYFLNNSMQNPRKGIFHYGLICNYCADLNFPFMGWDAFDSFAISAEWLEKSFQSLEREDIIIGAIIHHLGHTLGLTVDDHYGIDNVKTLRLSKEWFRYLPYRSCMNYFYKYQILTFSDGTNGPNDFNDWDNMKFQYFQYSSFIH